MAMTTNLGEVIKAAKPELALALQQVAQQRPPTRREKEAITQFLTLPPRQQNAVVTTHIQQMAQLNRRAPLVQMVARFVCTPRGASSIPMLLVCFARRPILHMFNFYAHARVVVSLHVLPFVSNFILDAR